jgi:hypothetical protein
MKTISQPEIISMGYRLVGDIAGFMQPFQNNWHLRLFSEYALAFYGVWFSII